MHADDQVQLFPNGTRIAVRTRENELQVWNLATRQFECTINPSYHPSRVLRLHFEIFPAEDCILTYSYSYWKSPLRQSTAEI